MLVPKGSIIPVSMIKEESVEKQRSSTFVCLVGSLMCCLSPNVFICSMNSFSCRFLEVKVLQSIPGKLKSPKIKEQFPRLEI